MAERRPNILLITTDQQRYDAMGLNGNPILRTPNLDALAASGTNFSRCYVTCPVCIPARRTLISGLHPTTHGMHNYTDGWEFDPAHTLPGELSNAGYQTQLVGKLHLHPQRKRFGFDHMILSESGNYRPDSKYQWENDYTDWLAEQGVRTISNAHGINGNGRNARPFHLDEPYHHSSWVANQAQRFFRGWRDPSCPWFMHLSFVAPHPPLIPPQAYWDRYIGRDDLAPTLGQWVPTDAGERRGVNPVDAIGPFPPDEIHDAIAGYYGLIHHIDDCIQHVIEAYFEYMTERSKEPTYILFTSDHGEMLGDHHLYRKSLAYESSAHVPLFITGRNVDVPKGQSDALATWEDLMPTILDLAGVDIPDGLDGRSLVPAMRGEGSGPREMIFGFCRSGGHSNFYLVHGPWKYIWFERTDEEQLFNLDDDPREQHDLSGQSSDLEAMRKLMTEHTQTMDDVNYDRMKLTPCANKPPKAFWPAG